MPERTPKPLLEPGSTVAAAAYTLLQQQLIDARDRLDRQVTRLLRMHRFSASMLNDGALRCPAAAFAEAVVDILDVELGGVWLAPDVAGWPLAASALCGHPADLDRRAAIAETLARLPYDYEAVILGASDLEALAPWISLRDGILARCISRDGSPVAIVLAGTTSEGDAYRPLTDDARVMLRLITDKFAVLLDHSKDIHLIEEQSRRREESEARLTRVLRGTDEGWWEWDTHTDHLLASDRLWEMFGYEPGHMDSTLQAWLGLVHPDDAGAPATIAAAAQADTTGTIELEVRIRMRSGDYLPILARGRLSVQADGARRTYSGTALDLTERKRQEARIHTLAFYDALTELPNRRLLNDRLENALLARRHTRACLAVLIVDLDRFKDLNDTHGHGAGDQLLHAVARLLVGVVGARDTVARLGGDEFVVLLEDLGISTQGAGQRAGRVGQALLDALNVPCRLGDIEHHPTASIGIALIVDDVTSAEAALQQADLALYAAKESGRNTLRLFNDPMQERVRRRSIVDTELRRALVDGQIRLHYQPQVDREGRIIGAEGLVRWLPTGRAPVPPNLFIPLAEESGSIHALGAWVLERSCTQLAAWQQVGLPDGFRLSMNISVHELIRSDFVPGICACLARSGALPERLRFELTEAAPFQDPAAVVSRFHELRALGIEISLDHFGAGVSSLSQLRTLPLDEVKIDGSFVRRARTDPADGAIVRAILSLGGALGLRVVAQGVETHDQLLLVREAGCARFQGYLFGHPRPATSDPTRLPPPER